MQSYIRSVAVDAAALAEEVKPSSNFFVKEYINSLLPGMIEFFLQIVIALLVYFIGSKLIKLAIRLLNHWLEKVEVEEGTKQFLNALLKYILYFILIVIILSFFGIPTASVIAILGSAGLTLGLALQGSLSNFAGGVIILLIKPFRVGDYIKEDTHNNEGYVTEISLFYTKLFTVDRKTIVVPNGSLANSSLTNSTFTEERRVDLKFKIAYEADMKLAKKVLLEAVVSDEYVIQEKNNRVYVDELDDSAVVIGVHAWVKNDNYWEAKWHLTEKLKLVLDDTKIEIPYSKLNIKMMD